MTDKKPPRPKPTHITVIAYDDPPPPPPPPHVHRWAWAILNKGGERQVCYDCGAER